MLELSPSEHQYVADIQEKLNGDLILFGSYYNTRFEDAFLAPNNKIDQRKKNYLDWILAFTHNTLEKYLVEVEPLKYRIDARAVLKHGNAVNLTILILRKKLAYYQDNQVISYEIT